MFLDSTVGKNRISKTFGNIKSKDQKIQLIELALQCGENPMRMFGIDFSQIRKIFGISEIMVANENLDNLGPLNQSLEEEQIYSYETLPTLNLSHHKKHILATYLFVKYAGDNIFDLFTTDEIAKLGGNDFISFCYNQKYCKHYKEKIPKLEEQISYTKNIAINFISSALITFSVLLFIFNFVAFNPLLFTIAPAIGFAVGVLTGKHVYKRKQKLNQSVETTDWENFRNAYLNEINNRTEKTEILEEKIDDDDVDKNLDNNLDYINQTLGSYPLQNNVLKKSDINM